MNAIEQVKKLGGTIDHVDCPQRWMQFRANIPGVVTGWGAEPDEAAEDAVSRLPAEGPVQCALPLEFSAAEQSASLTPIQRLFRWRRGATKGH